MVSDLYDLYEAAVSDLARDSISSPTDSQILARMLALLKPRNEMASDFSRMAIT